IRLVGQTGGVRLCAACNAVARVATAAGIASFTATPSSSNQGEAVTLRWDGTFATGWKLSDGTTTVELGPAKTRLVRPLATTTYTLTAIGLGGNDTMSRLVTVGPSPGTTL